MRAALRPLETARARRQRYPDETPYVYRPFAESGEVCRWTPDIDLEDYNLLDLSI